ncbi:uncharacterized protein LOC135947443 [Cloeon dipterum]|uniref:uncharacterized protein LOC135947443 n=1 Tax=Cloeon dipterum TaxID=197152 RepID=UPI003220690B
MSVKELEALIDDFYKFICETLSNEKLSTSANALKESLKHRIQLCRAASKNAGHYASPPPPQVVSVSDDLPDYGEVEDEMPEYEETEVFATTVVVHRVNQEPPQPPAAPQQQEDEQVTVQSLVSTAVMHGSLVRKDRVFIIGKQKCWAAATVSSFHVFNSETDFKPYFSVQLTDMTVNVPQKDKKDVLFEVNLPATNKQFKFAAPSASDRDRWLSVLSQGKLKPYENQNVKGRSLPETPLELEKTSPRIEEDNDSLDNYEPLGAKDEDDEEIYNSLESLSDKRGPPPPPPRSGPELPKSRRPALGPPDDDDDVEYDDIGRNDNEDDQDMYYDIEEARDLVVQMRLPPPPPPRVIEDDDVIYDDTEPLPSPPTVPKFPSRPNGAPPLPPVKVQISIMRGKPPSIDDDPQDEYDEVGPPSVMTPPFIAAKKVGPPPPNRSDSFLFRAMKKHVDLEEPAEEYDEVGPPAEMVKPLPALPKSLPAIPKPPPSIPRSPAEAPKPPDDSHMAQMFRGVKLKPTLDLSSANEQSQKPAKVGWKPPSPKEDITDANTMKARLASLRPVGSPTSPKPLASPTSPKPIGGFTPPPGGFTPPKFQGGAPTLKPVGGALKPTGGITSLKPVGGPASMRPAVPSKVNINKPKPPPSNAKPSAPPKALASKLAQFERANNNCNVETEGKMKVHEMIQKMGGK